MEETNFNDTFVTPSDINEEDVDDLNGTAGNVPIDINGFEASIS
jgi:hypothetical protein